MAKLTIQFPDSVNDLLVQMAKIEETTKTEVIRRAIALLKFVEDERLEGNKIVVADENDRLVKEIVFPSPRSIRRRTDPEVLPDEKVALAKSDA